jgi:alkylhydroperoxidase/carboxymuconolactone decarboxylase family protein YurZ
VQRDQEVVDMDENEMISRGMESFREKRLVVMGILAGLGADPSLFTIHTKSALRNGEMSADDARAVVLMALPYVGFAKASPIFVATEALIAEESKQETVADAAAPPS